MPRAQPRPLTGGAVMSAGSRIAVTVAGAVTTIVLARLLGPDGWGTFFVAQSLFLMLTAVTGLGIEHGITYYVSSGRWGPGAAYRTALKVALLLGLAGATIGLGARALIPSSFAGLSLWLTAAVVVGLPFGLVRFYVSYVALATDRYEAYVAMSALQAFLALALAVPGAVLFDVEGAIVAAMLSTIVVGVGSALWAQRRLPPAGAARAGQLRRAISFGVKGYAANALQMINYRLDLFILSAVASTAVVGNYSTAVAVTSLLWVLPTALSDVVFPRVAYLESRAHANALEAVETKGLRHASIAVLFGGVTLAVALALLLVPVLGTEFQPAVNLGLMLLPGAALIGLASILGASVVGRGKPIYSLYGSLITTPVTIALYATLIPWLDATGAAVASTLSYALGFLVLCWFYRRVTGRPVLRALIPTRSEFEDLRALTRRIATRTRGAHRHQEEA